MTIVYTEINSIIASTPGASLKKAFFEELKSNVETLEMATPGGTVDTDGTLTGDGSALDPLSVAVPVPAPADPADDGKVFTAGSGAGTWQDAPTGLPSTSGASEDEVLTLDAGLNPIWAAGTPGPKGDPGADGGFDSVQTINTVSEDYALQLSDAGKLIDVTDAAVITIPTNATAAISIGQRIDILAATASLVRFEGAMGVTLRDPYGTAFKNQWGVATLIKRDTDEWVLVGDLEEYIP